MKIKNKILMKAVIVAGLMLGSTATFAAKVELFPGVTDPCEQLWLVNDHNNEYLAANEGGECIDIPVNLHKVKVLFNVDAPILNPGDKDAANYPDGSAVALKHMYMLGTVMQHRIEIGEMLPEDVAIVGIMHGGAMRAGWAFKAYQGGPNPVKYWIDKIFELKDAGINIQLEACGVTLKGMQKKGVVMNTPAGPQPIDERAIYSNGNNKIYLNQGAVGRMIELQQSKFVYLQEE